MRSMRAAPTAAMRSTPSSSSSALNDFQSEKRLYCDDAIRGTLPRMLQASDNASSALVSRSGYPWPPFLVLERGTSLRECAPLWTSDWIPMLGTAKYLHDFPNRMIADDSRACRLLIAQHICALL